MEKDSPNSSAFREKARPTVSEILKRINGRDGILESADSKWNPNPETIAAVRMNQLDWKSMGTFLFNLGMTEDELRMLGVYTVYENLGNIVEPKKGLLKKITLKKMSEDERDNQVLRSFKSYLRETALAKSNIITWLGISESEVPIRSPEKRESPGHDIAEIYETRGLCVPSARVYDIRNKTTSPGGEGGDREIYSGAVEKYKEDIKRGSITAGLAVEDLKSIAGTGYKGGILSDEQYAKIQGIISHIERNVGNSEFVIGRDDSSWAALRDLPMYLGF